MKKITYGIMAAIMGVLGLNACATGKSAAKKAEQARIEQQRRDSIANADYEQAMREKAIRDSIMEQQRRMETDPGRNVCLYGGPNMRYRENLIPEE